MYYKLLTAQLKNSKRTTIIFTVVVMVIVSFFSLSANLYHNTSKNVETASDAFTTIGVIELFKGLNKYGQQTTVGSSDYIGYFSTVTDDLNQETLLSLPGVTWLDLRRTFAAYIPEALQYSSRSDMGDIAHCTFQDDLIVFMLKEEETVTFDVKKGNQFADIIVLSNVNPIYTYKSTVTFHFEPMESIDEYQQDVQRLNRSPIRTDLIQLEPGVRYFAVVRIPYTRQKTKEGFIVDRIDMLPDLYGAETYPHYYKGKSIAPYIDYQVSVDQPFWIWREDDLKQTTEVQAYYEKAAEAIRYSNSSFAVMTTENVEIMLPFYQGKLAVAEGRVFSKEEYVEGRRVCMVSRKLAEIQGWQVGDTLPMQFYQYDGIYEDADGEVISMPDAHYIVYQQDNGGFFDQGEYTIVGIWNELPVQQSNGLDPRTDALLFNTIIVPTSSVQNLDIVDAPASGSRLTVHLENGRMEEFLEAASKVTLSESADEVRITAFDQGYSQAQDSLQSMLGTAQFLLALSSVLLVVAGVLLAFFYTQSQKQNMALMRLLGCNRRQAGTMAMLGSLLILLPGGLIGAGVGHLLTNRVASAILNGTSTLDKPEYAGFREIFGVQAEVEFALAAQPAVSAAALAIAAGLFLAGCLFFTLLLLRKEPREALQDK